MEDITRGGQFLVKETKCENIFTPEDFSEEQVMMRDSVKEFVDKEIWPFKDRFEKKDYALTEETMRKAGEMGFLSIAVPEAYGGMGMGFVDTCLVCDYISGATGSFSTAFGAHTGIGTMPITLYGTEEQKQKYVPKLASGEWFGAYCLTEPGAGSDANSGKTKAVLSEDGTHYKITGQKMWISNAGFCSLFIVFARIEDDKNITGFILENTPDNGISFGEEEHKLGIRASSTRQVFFNETKVPVENMLSERGNGFKIAMNALNVGRIKLAAACLDAQRRVTSNAISYANDRVQFNTPIASFGAIRAKLAEMATSTYAGESATYRAAQDIETRIKLREAEGISHQEAELKGVEELRFICENVTTLGLDKSALDLDVTLARGLNYYTGAIFEVKAIGVQMGSISGGGRYDNLTGTFGLPDVSGVGISLGVDRIYDVMEELNLFPASALHATEVLLTHFDEPSFQAALPLLMQLRNASISAELYPDIVKLKKQLDYANKKQIPYVIVIGSEEIETGLYTLKNMETGEQFKASIAEIIEKINA